MVGPGPAPINPPQLPHLQGAEVAERRRALLAQVPSADAWVLFLDAFVAHFSGFTFVPTERPIALVVGPESCTLVVPFLEEDHARREGQVDEVVTYEEYPGPEAPMGVLARCLKDAGLARAGRHLAVDSDGYPPLWGYHGPTLSALVAARVVPQPRRADEVMMVKSDYEVAMLAESARWAGRAHWLLAQFTTPGARETEVSLRASTQATSELVAARPDYRAGAATSGARAGYRGQIGRRSALPHTMAVNAAFQAGDTLVTGATAPMWGYVSELERTMFLGEPSPRQAELFGHMLALQDLCLDAIRPGVPAAAVDEAMRGYFAAHGLWPLWRHHVGHGIGRRYHEAPFLDRGDDTTLAAGMVLTVEPGLYDPDWGGFRHSDTVLVTGDGCRLLTDYPRQLAELVLPA